MGFANPQALINQRLKSVTGIQSVTVVPKTRPPRFIRTIRTGGYLANGVTDVARITVECWNDGTSEPPGTSAKVAAERDAQQARAALLALRGVSLQGVKVHRVEEIAAPADSPDPDSTTPRYVFTHEVHMRGTHRKGQ